MPLSQTKVVDYAVKWLENQDWKVIYAHYPEGHHISSEYGRLRIIQRKFIDIIAKRGKCLLLIQCNKKFKLSYLKKLNKINKESIKQIDFGILLKGIAFHIKPSTEDEIYALKEGYLLFEVKRENMIKLYGAIPQECMDE